jgi:hypothetical protein
MKYFVALTLCLISAGCTETPTTPTVWTSDEVRQQVIATNLNHPTSGNRGRLTRWRGPIAVHTNNIARAELAVDRYEQWSGGVIRFTRSSTTPTNGIVFVEGSAKDADNSPGCGHVTDAPAGTDSNTFAVRWDAASALIGTYTIHLGSPNCDDVKEGRYASAYAEHVLAHALGVFDHFIGYTGPEGMVDAHAFAVVYNLYANPVGAAAQDLVIWPATPR